jgi:transcriptional regulator with XRE-family HTH domain
MYEIYQELLDKKGLKNSDVSRATGISNMTLSDWKRGKTKPKIDKMKLIAEFLNVSVDYLMTGKEMEFTVEMADIDSELIVQEKRLKEYFLKIANMTDEQKEYIMSTIDFVSKGGK